MLLQHKCKVEPKPIVQYHIVKTPYDFEEASGWYIALYFEGETLLVRVKYCPHCGIELPPACGCCGGKGQYQHTSGVNNLCEICHGSGEEQD